MHGNDAWTAYSQLTLEQSIRAQDNFSFLYCLLPLEGLEAH